MQKIWQKYEILLNKIQNSKLMLMLLSWINKCCPMPEYKISNIRNICSIIYLFVCLFTIIYMLDAIINKYIAMLIIITYNNQSKRREVENTRILTQSDINRVKSCIIIIFLLWWYRICIMIKIITIIHWYIVELLANWLLQVACALCLNYWINHINMYICIWIWVCVCVDLLTMWIWRNGWLVLCSTTAIIEKNSGNSEIRHSERIERLQEATTYILVYKYVHYMYSLIIYNNNNVMNIIFNIITENDSRRKMVKKKLSGFEEQLAWRQSAITWNFGTLHTHIHTHALLRKQKRNNWKWKDAK